MKLALILLAAGDSRRFGSNKLLHDFLGMPMYRHVAGEVAKLPPGLFCEKIVVSQYPEILEDLGQKGYLAVENKDSALGISHSIALGVSAVSAPDAAYCFAVCDQPYLRADTMKALAERFQSCGRGIACLCHGEELGNPAIFAGSYRKELLSLTGDVGGKRVIRRHKEDLCRLEVEDARELEDVDVPEKVPCQENAAPTQTGRIAERKTP